MAKETDRKIVPHIWLEKDAEGAAEFYVSTFRNSKILRMSYYTAPAADISGQKKGTVMTVSFKIEGQKFIALNGGPLFKPNEAISFVVYCRNQEEIDELWEKLSFAPEAERCGWLKDKFGISRQIVPTILEKMITDNDVEKVERVTATFLKMKKLDIKELNKAFQGG